MKEIVINGVSIPLQQTDLSLVDGRKKFKFKFKYEPSTEEQLFELIRALKPDKVFLRLPEEDKTYLMYVGNIHYNVNRRYGEWIGTCTFSLIQC